MKTNLLKSGMVLVILSAVVVTGQAGETNAWKRIGLSYRAGFNISGSFSGLGGFNAAGNSGGPGQIAGAPGTVVRTYDDGFIGIDISGNANQHTTFWGYNDSGAQVVGGNVQMHSTGSPATAGSGDVDGDPQHGFEINYLHPLGSGENWHWGVEGAFNWTDISIRDHSTLAGSVVTTTHAFALDGALPPLTPPVYVGPVDGPGAPQLNDTAVDASGPPLAGAATINGTRKIAANLYGFRLGPYVELPLGGRFSVTLGGGLSLGVMDSEFSFNETVTIAGFAPQNRTGSNHRSEFLYGGYVRGLVNLRLCKSASLFGGVEFNSLSSFNQSAGGANAHLDLSAGVYVTGGFTFNF